jgi:tripartite-type tricarboxylate transporter receptor subunit TctC
MEDFEFGSGVSHETHHFIIPYPPGGSTDLTGRALVNAAKNHLKQPIVCENKAGGGGTVGPSLVVSKPPDGYTIGIGVLTLITSKLQGLFPYDYRDFTLMGSFTAQYPMIVASTKTQRPFTTFEEQ